MIQIFKIEIIVGTIVILFSTLISFSIRRCTAIPYHFKIFYIYPLTAFILSLVTITNYHIYSISKIYINIFENSILLIENIFWGVFFLSYFNKKKARNNIKKAFISSLLVVLILTIINKFDTPNYKIAGVSNLGFVLYCLIFLNNLFKNDPVKKISELSIFWIVIGLFFYAVFSTSLFPLCEYLKNQNNSMLLIVILCVINLLVIIMHLFFIKGYQCLIRQHKASLYLY